MFVPLTFDVILGKMLDGVAEGVMKRDFEGESWMLLCSCN